MMTAEQYCFPYLFDVVQFNLKLKSFDLHAHIVSDPETQMPEQLLITKENDSDTLLIIPFGACMMVEKENLYFWDTDTDAIDIRQVSLKELTPDPWMMNLKIDLTTFNTGKTIFNAHLDTAQLVTFARKSSVTYQQEEYEQFVIVLLEKNSINIIPFHSFNQATSTLSYTWPITATLDFSNKTLYGKGMRMKDFEVELAWAL